MDSVLLLSGLIEDRLKVVGGPEQLGEKKARIEILLLAAEGILSHEAREQIRRRDEQIYETSQLYTKEDRAKFKTHYDRFMESIGRCSRYSIVP